MSPLPPSPLPSLFCHQVIVIVSYFRKEGVKPSEYTKLRDYLYQTPSDETQRSTTLLATLQGQNNNNCYSCYYVTTHIFDIHGTL